MVDVFTDTVTLSLIATCDIGDSTFIYSSKLLLSEPSFPVENIRSFVSPIAFTVTATDTLIIMKDMANTNVDTIDVNNIDFDITLGYIPLKTKALMSFISNVPDDTAFINHEVPPTVIFPNVDYADRKFFKFEEHTLAYDSMEVHPARLTGITFYSTALTGSNKTLAYNYFNVPEFNINAKVVDFYGGSDAADGSLTTPYLTFEKALGSISDGDTVYVKSSTSLTTSVVGTKGICIIGLGNFIKTTTTGFTASGANSGVIIRNVYIKTSTTGISLSNSTGDVTIKNCYIKGTLNPIYSVTITPKSIYLSDNVCVGTTRVQYFSLISSGNYYANAILCGKIYSKWDDYHGGYCWTIEIYTTSLKASFCNLVSLFSTENRIPTTRLDITVDRCSIVSRPNYFVFYHVVTGLNKPVTLTITNSTYNNTNYMITYGLLSIDSIYLYNNTITSKTDDLFRFSAPNDSSVLYLSNNNFNSDDNYILRVTDYNIIAKNNIFNSDSTGSLYILSNKFDSLTVIVDSNIWHSERGNTACLCIGAEYDTLRNNTISGYVRGNEFYGPSYYGNSMIAKHGIFEWGQNIEYSNNYVNGISLAFVLKANGKEFENKLVNNIIEDCVSPFVIKGIKGVEIYNNTSVNCGYSSFLAEGYTGASGTSGNTKIKNNIFISNTNALYFYATTDTIGCEIENNLYYNYQDIAKVATSTFSLSEWQSQGFDLNSYVSNPTLDATYTPATGSDAINNGTDLGIETDYYGNSRVGNTDIGAVEKQ
jgi:hypothetical protein